MGVGSGPFFPFTHSPSEAKPILYVLYDPYVQYDISVKPNIACSRYVLAHRPGSGGFLVEVSLMMDRAMTLGIGSAIAAALAVSVSLYSTAHAQATGTQTPPAAGPRGIAGGQDLQQIQQARPNPAQFGGGGSIAADQGVVYVLRGNVLFAVSSPANGRMRLVDQFELPPPNRGNLSGQNPFRPGGQQPPPQRGNGGGSPPPGK